jgi:hypothetical protein
MTDEQAGPNQDSQIPYFFKNEKNFLYRFNKSTKPTRHPST